MHNFFPEKSRRKALRLYFQQSHPGFQIASHRPPIWGPETGDRFARTDPTFFRTSWGVQVAKTFRPQVTVPLALLLLSQVLSGAEPEKARPGKKLWIASVLALTAASFLDVRSSVGHYELNPLLSDSQGQFNTARAAAYKSAAIGGLIVTEAIWLRKHKATSDLSALVNFGGASAMATAAVANRRTPVPAVTVWSAHAAPARTAPIAK